MSIGTVIGMTRRGPFSRSVSHASRRVQTPPMPGGEVDAESLRLDIGAAGIRPRLARRDERELRGRVEALRLGALEHRVGTDGGLARRRSRAARTASTQSYSSVRAPEAPAEQGGPALGRGAAERRGRADAGDDDAGVAHVVEILVQCAGGGARAPTGACVSSAGGSGRSPIGSLTPGST